MHTTTQARVRLEGRSGGILWALERNDGIVRCLVNRRGPHLEIRMTITNDLAAATVNDPGAAVMVAETWRAWLRAEGWNESSGDVTLRRKPDRRRAGRPLALSPDDRRLIEGRDGQADGP